MVFAMFCKNVIKMSNRSYFVAYYKKCVSCETFIDFQYPWNELLFFFVLLEKISYIWPPVIEQHFFFNLPCKVFSVDSFWPAFPVPSTWTLTSPPHPNPVTWRQLCMWRKVNMNVNIPTPPQPSDVTSVVHVTQVNMNVNIPTPPQPSDVTSVVHVTQVNMNVNIPTPPQPSDVTSVLHASISRATCLQSAKMAKTRGSLIAP